MYPCLEHSLVINYSVVKFRILTATQVFLYWAFIVNVKFLPTLLASGDE
jgi:hypothetical protein